MLKILKYLRPIDFVFMVFGAGLIVLQVWLELKMPEYLNEVLTLARTPDSAMSEIWKNGGLMMLCAVSSLASAIIVGFFISRIAAGFAATLREQVFNKTLSFSMEEINKFSSASLITRTTNDVTQVNMFIAMGFQSLVKAPVLAVWAIIKISNKSWQWTAATGAAVGVLFIMILVIVIFALPKFKQMQVLTDNLNRETRENLTGLRVVRSFNAEKYQESKFSAANEKLTSTQLFTGRIMSILMPGMSIIMMGLNLSIYWIGARLIQDAASPLIQFGLFQDMLVFSSYAMQVVMAFILLTIIFIMLPRASVAAKRINEVLETPLSIKDGKVADSNSELKGEVEFINVGFKYPDAAEAIIKNISFKAKKGETVAFIGSTGSGKSTLINLVPRFYDATEGEVLIDGVNVKDYTLEALHDKIGYVPQKAVLFSGTINSNIAFGKNGDSYSHEQVAEAVRIAQASEFVETAENKYESAVSQGGTNLSGGQKQRVAIARAVCKKPEIYIFDDSFSALDYKTDKVLREVLKKETADATKLIVAQRIGTIRDADKILVLEEGDVVGMGTHDELMETCKVYQEIAYSQLSKEELENA